MKKLKPDRMLIIKEINKVAYITDKDVSKAKQILTNLINSLSNEEKYFKMTDRVVKLKVENLVNKLFDIRNTMEDDVLKSRNMLKQTSANMIKQSGKLFRK